MKWQIIKRYGHDLGLSAVFKQFRAPETHCSKLHGYALAFEVCFEGEDLDNRNWLISFGDLKPFKQWLQDTFDHKLVVSIHDPHLRLLLALEEAGGCDLMYVEEVGCEMFAQMAYNWLNEHLNQLAPRQAGKKYQFIDMEESGVRVKYVMCSEHNGNSAIYSPSEDDLMAETFGSWFDEDENYVTIPFETNEDAPFYLNPFERTLITTEDMPFYNVFGSKN
jgi:6-pyruvoyltetrahydropterin/6-carboxytetrahydropterin synthase